MQGTQSRFSIDDLLAAAPRARVRVRRVLSSFAMQDWMVGAYLMVLLVGVALGAGTRRPLALGCVVADCVVFAACMVASRIESESASAGATSSARWQLAGGVLYRFGLIGVVVGSFLQLHVILPTVSSRLVDGSVYALDLRLFGFEPSMSWDRFVTPATTEWFSFFYYSYFFILCAYLLPMAAFERRLRVLSELSAGLLFVVCVGHCLYLAVPGLGPHSYLRGQFGHELAGGFWWPIVKRAVDSVGGTSGGSRTDIFPSLHTACPTFLTLFSFRNRAHKPYRYVWPVTAFFTSQIILATMFLRWHYLIDVIAGLTLATVAFLVSRAVPALEARLRGERGVGPVWRPLFGRARP